MHTAILWICAASALLVFVVMIHSVATFRGSSEAAAAKPRHRKLVEVAWALVPIAICIAAALPAMRVVTPSEIGIAQVSITLSDAAHWE